ncbi:MAG: hypothetical protein IM669_04985 [Phenylobacterium sp.]|uniref:hypothetical protein n=1 Tax=Phenylobacterium sp. TaxID=1871053 RepID=UPI0025DBD2E5|nr:hypothetical protein [Phenylobacterium sp.]MCA3756862.1 hypothetical protein [Phenylobacterium sp.]
MVELHASSNPAMELTFRDGLVRALVWPYRRPTQTLFAILCLSALALYAWDREFSLRFWLLCVASGIFHAMALLGLPGRLEMQAAQPEAVRRVLFEAGCTSVSGSEPKTWRLQTAPPWVKPSNSRFNVLFDHAKGRLEGDFVFLLRVSRNLRAAGAG